MDMSFDQPISLRCAIICFAVVFTLSALPIVFATIPPLHDYPFHLARIHILDQWHQSPELQRWYDLNSFLLPNVAIDVVVLALAQIMPLEAAGQLFVALTLALMLGGCVYLHRAIHGSYTLWPFVSCFFLFNWILLWGFMNYLFGIGVMLWALGVWIADRHRSVWRRFLLGTGFAVVLFFSHLIVLGLFAVLVAGFELQRSAKMFKRNRIAAIGNLLIGAAIFALPALLYWMSSTAGATNQDNTYYQPWLWMKIFAAWRSLMAGNWVIDIPLMATFVLMAVVVLLYGKWRLASSMRLALILLIVTYLAMPGHLMGVVLVDIRLPVAIIFVLIGASRLQLHPRGLQRTMVGLLAVFLVFRCSVLCVEWRRYDAIINEYRQAYARLPFGSILFVGFESRAISFWHRVTDLRGWQPPLQHVGSLAAIDQTVFVPATWAHPERQTIRLKPEWDQIHAFQHFNPRKIGSLRARIGIARHFEKLVSLLPAPRPAAYFMVINPRFKKQRLSIIVKYSPRLIIWPLNQEAVQQMRPRPPNSNIYKWP